MAMPMTEEELKEFIIQTVYKDMESKAGYLAQSVRTSVRLGGLIHEAPFVSPHKEPKQ